VRAPLAHKAPQCGSFCILTRMQQEDMGLPAIKIRKILADKSKNAIAAHIRPRWRYELCAMEIRPVRTQTFREWVRYGSGGQVRRTSKIERAVNFCPAARRYGSKSARYGSKSISKFRTFRQQKALIFCKIKAFHGAGSGIRTPDLMITKFCRHGLSAALASVRRCSLGFALLFEPVRSVVSTGFFPLMGQRMGQKNRPRRTARRRRFSFLCREYNSCVRRCQIILRVRKRPAGCGRVLRELGLGRRNSWRNSLSIPCNVANVTSTARA
jgi:hypothetical protein